MQRSAVWLALAIVLAGILLARETQLGTFARADSKFLDWLVANSSQVRAVNSEVVVFELRDDTTDVAKARPFTPLECALFFQAISRFDPPVIVAEPLLRWEPPQPEGEQMVLQRALKLSRLIASSQLGGELKENDDSVFPENLPVLRMVEGDTSRIPEYRAIAVTPFDELTLAATRGFTNMGNDRNRMPLLFRFRGELIPSVMLQTLISWKRLTPAEVKIQMGKSITVGNSLTIPIDSTGAMLVNRSLRDSIPRVGVDDLLVSIEQMDSGAKSEMPENMIRHGITILGYDVRSPRPVSKEPQATAADLATAIATVQSGNYIERAAPWIGYAITAAVALFALILRRASGFIGLLICLATLGVYGLISLWIFESTRIWMPFALPAILLLFLGFARLFLPKPKAA